MMDIEQQVGVLLRGTLFADEVEGGEATGASSLTKAQESPDGSEKDVALSAEGSLRRQMTAELRDRLHLCRKEDRPLRVYLGADPTATSLHIGHFVPVQKLRVFQQLGHQVVFLIGDYTGLIGDPTGQSTTRKRFTHEELRAMSADYTSQVFRLLDPEKTEVRYNGDWLSKLTFAKLVELAAIFPLKWVISRRDFQERMERGESLRLHETLYCLMQGYDAFALECDVQVGGYDQHFNMLAGRWIQEQFGQKPHIVWTYPLLLGTDGRKMSKSYGNAVNILDTPEDMYGKCMRISDDLICSYIDLTTDLSPDRAEELKARLKEPSVNPMEVKKEVAASLVRQYHGAGAAASAARHFESTVQRKEVPDEVPEVRIPDDLHGRSLTWPDLLTSLEHDGCALAPSKGEVRRLIQQGGFYVNQEPVKEIGALYMPAPETLIRMGKRKYFKIIG